MKTEYITACSLIITEDCTCACKYCFENKNRNCEKVMSVETGQKCIDFLYEQAFDSPKKDKHVSFTFFGGEPLMYPDICDGIFQYAVEKRKKTNIDFSATIITNATCMNDKIELMLHRWARQAHVNMQLSVDGDRKSHEKNRILKNGKSSFDKVIKNIPAFQRTNPGLCLHNVVTKDTLPDLYHNYRFFYDSFPYAKIWSFPILTERWTDKEVDIYDDQLRQIFQHETDLGTVSAFAPIDKTLSVCHQSHLTNGKACSAGTSYISFTPDGDMWPCHNFYFNDPKRELYLGNVSRGITKKGKEILKMFSECTIEKMGCKECPNISCYTCMADNWVISHDISIVCGKSLNHCKLSNIEKKWQDEARKTGAMWEERKKQQEKGKECCSAAKNPQETESVQKFLGDQETINQSILTMFGAIDNRLDKLEGRSEDTEVAPEKKKESPPETKTK